MTIRSGQLKGAKASRRGLKISYLLFIDNSIIFRKAIERGGTLLKNIPKKYELCSNQSVNPNESIIFF